MSAQREAGESSHWMLHVVLALAVLYAAYPILWVLTVAFSGEQSLMFVDLPADPTLLQRLRTVIPWPDRISLSNFKSVVSDQPFALWLFNSVLVASATTVVGVFLSCTAAYAFSRFRFPGRRAGLMSFLVSQMFPGVLTLIPLYIILVQWLGLGSSRLGLVLVYSPPPRFPSVCGCSRGISTPSPGSWRNLR
jgi:arabinogalactan oligomer / maltooligosaccharide transport system permease protein